MDIDVKRNCDWDFPWWEAKSHPGGISFETPSMCHACDFQMQCHMILSAPLLGMPELAPQSEEAEIIMAQIQKATMMNAEWIISDNKMWKYAMEAQGRIIDLWV